MEATSIKPNIIPISETISVPDVNLLTKPPLKWVGGKTQIIQQVLKVFPRQIQNYHEPFVGGGSVLLAVLSLVRTGHLQVNGTIHASDLNPNLINFYQTLQQRPVELVHEISRLRNTYDEIQGTTVNRQPTSLAEALTSKESYYYWIRQQYNLSASKSNTVLAAAYFVFLNKTCFRGIYREGPNGFNVPYGHYTRTPNILSANQAQQLSELLQGVCFTVADFETSLALAQPGDWVYLDPPYVPETDTSFVGYNSDGFSFETHLRLFCELHRLTQQDIHFAMSNAMVPIITTEFSDYQLHPIQARRAINSKNPASTTTEVLVVG